MKSLRGQNAGRACRLSILAKPVCAILGVLLLFSGVAGATPNITGFLVNGVPSNTGPVNASLTIQGSGFGDTRGFSTATLNGIAVAGNGVTPTSWSDTSIVVTIPNTASSGPVIVKVSGVSSNAVNFNIGALITSISASTATVGSTITITGAGFGTAVGTVTFGGAPATTSSWNPSSIQAQVPNAATAGSIIVSVGGQASNGVAFTPTPVITGVSPGSGVTGTTVTITGTGFGSVQGSVTFSSIQGTVKTWGINSITVRAPQDGTLGANNIVVTTNGISSSGACFTIIPTVSVWPAASAITFGQTLASSTLSGGTAAVAGSFAFTTPSTAPAAGTALQSVTFTPTDTADFYAVSSTVNVTVNQASVTLSLVVSPGGTPNFGTTMTFTTTVTPSNLTGNITFADGSTTLGTAPINNGEAVFTTSTLDTGAHSITASFPGSSNFVSATSAAVSVPVGSAPVQVDICCAGTSVYGNSASFKATITPLTVNPRQKVPTGTVFFDDNDISHLLCEAAVSAGPTIGTANCTTSELTGGNHNILVNYVDPTNTYRDPNNSESIVWAVTPAASSVTLASDSPNNTSHTGQRVTFTATVTGVQGGATPTGTVVFNDTFKGSTTQVNGPVGTNGQAAFSTFFNGTASAGQHSITAVYNQDNADKNYQSSTSNAVLQTVNIIPAITSMTPTNGPAGMGFSLSGTSFGNNAGTVTINGAQATVLQWSDTKITLQVPGTAAGAYPPVITTSDNKASDPKSTQNFTVRARIVPCNP